MTALLSSRYRMAVNTVAQASWRQRWIWIGLGIGWAGLIFVLAWEIRFVARDAITHRMVQSAFLYLGALMLASGAPQLFSTLFLSPDIQWLRSSPTPLRLTVAIKLLDGLFVGGRVFLPVLIASWAAIGSALGLSAVGWVFTGFLWLIYTATIALVGSSLILGLTLLVGPGRVRQALAALQLGVPVALLIGLIGSVGDLESVLRFDRLPMPPSFEYTPADWAAKAALGFSIGSWSHVLLGTALLIGFGVFAYLLSIMLGERIYDNPDAFEKAAQLKEGKVSSALTERHRRSALSALVVKELRLLRRDPMTLYQTLTPLLLLGLPLALELKFPMRGSSDLITTVTFALIGGMLYLQTSVLALSSVGLDGRAYWLIQSSPATPLVALLAKQISTILVCVGSAWAGLLFYSILFAIPFWLSLGAFAAALLAGSALAGIGVGISAAFPKFDWDHPGQRVSFWALLWGFVSFSAYVLAVGLIAYGASYIGANFEFARASDYYWVWAAGIVWLIVASLFCALAPIVWGSYALARLGWEE